MRRSLHFNDRRIQTPRPALNSFVRSELPFTARVAIPDDRAGVQKDFPRVSAFCRPRASNAGGSNLTVNVPWASDKVIRVWWRKACIAAKVRYRYPYQLRHTYASWMLKFREEPLWISKQMGHADVSETLETYVKFIPSLSPDAGMGAYAAIMAAKNRRD